MLRMMGALRSRNKWDEEPSGGGLLIAILHIRQVFQCPRSGSASSVWVILNCQTWRAKVRYELQMHFLKIRLVGLEPC